MKKILLLLLIVANCAVRAQPSCEWAYIPVGVTTTYNTIYYIKTDHSGNSIAVGKILGSADMDPASGPADTSFSDASYNWYISKTSIAGKLEWIHYFQKNSQLVLFEFMGLEINSQNEIIVCGNFYGMIDFDLSDSGVDTLRSHFATYPDYFIAKYDSLGNYSWAMNIGDSTTNTVEVQSMSLLSNDNIVISVNPNGVLDIDPSNGVHNSIGFNANIICYDSNGNYIWNNHTSPTYTYGIPVKSISNDAIGNSYLLSVGYYELTVSKFDNAGLYLWSKKIGNFSSNGRVNPQTILVDKMTSEFYISGTFGGTVDFDPGPVVADRTASSVSFQDGFIAKYDPEMNLIWINAYQGEVSFGINSLDFDNSEIIAVGNLGGTIDFGNGQIFTSQVSLSPFFLKLDTGGIAQSGFVLDGNGKFSIVNATINQSMILIGNVTGTTDMDPGTAVYPLNVSSSNYFTAVYRTAVPTTRAEKAQRIFIEAFPNPSRNFFNLRTDDTLIGTLYTCYDYIGKIIAEGKIEKENTVIQLANTVSGVYFLKVQGENVRTIKLVKE